MRGGSRLSTGKNSLLDFSVSGDRELNSVFSSVLACSWRLESSARKKSSLEKRSSREKSKQLRGESSQASSEFLAERRTVYVVLFTESRFGQLPAWWQKFGVNLEDRERIISRT